MEGISLERPDGGRMQWMDVLRGSAILLVLLWHAPAVPALFGVAMPDSVRALNDFFRPFRMPTLMFLSGLLLPRALRKSRFDYYLGKAQLLIWPYVLWCLIYFLQYPPPAPLYVWRVWYATGYLWFLCFIAIYYLVAPLLVRLPLWLPPLVCMAASAVVATSVETRLFYFATFFFIGRWCATDERLLAAVRGWRLAGVALIGTAWGVTSVFLAQTLSYRAEFILFSLCGTLALCWAAMRVRGRVVRPLAFVGRNSLIYYVVHFPVMTALTLGAARVGLDQSPALWLVNLVVAVAACTWLARHRESWWIAWLFRAPEFLVRPIRHLHHARPARPAVDQRGTAS